MLNLQYKIHHILYSKNKQLFNLAISILLFFFLNLYFNDNTLVECMKSSNPLIDRSSDNEYIEFLEAEAWRMDDKISELEHHTAHLQKEVDNLKLDNKRLSDRLTALEHKSTAEIKSQDDRKIPVDEIERT